MGHLDTLEVSRRVLDTAHPRRTVDTVEYRRAKLIANLEEQLELAERALRDEPLQLKRKRGRQVVTVRPRLWWKVEPDGHVATQVRYNKVALKVKNGGTTIEVGPLKKLPAVYRKLIRAVKAGELDSAIAVAAGAIRKR
jgi:hypothetical protein